MVQMVHQGIPPWIAIFLGLTIGIVVGFVNGFITLRFGIPSFIATLGMLYIARSLTTVATAGFPPPFPHELPNELFVYQFELFRASLYWALLVAVILGVLGLIGKIPDYQIVEKYSMMGCALFSLIAFVYWLLMAPIFDSDSIVFGSGYYLTMFSILLLVSASIFSFINSSKPTKTIVF